MSRKSGGVEEADLDLPESPRQAPCISDIPKRETDWRAADGQPLSIE